MQIKKNLKGRISYMGYFSYKGCSCYYEEFGTGKPLIFLHGNTASSRIFSKVIGEYSSTYKVILIDFLGHGKSDRVPRLATDLWHDEAEQVIEFIKQRDYKRVFLIGSSGGALVAINVALEAPDMVEKIIADSFEGEIPLRAFTENVIQEREQSKHDENMKIFYRIMHGEDWENVVDNDTQAIVEHDKTIGKFFHKPLRNLITPIIMTGSKEDEFITAIDPKFFESTYGSMIEKIGHGKMYLFEKGGHPAMISNIKEFVKISKQFLEE